MPPFISRPSFLLHDDSRLHRAAGILFCVAGAFVACWKPPVWILWGGLLTAGGTALWRAYRNRVLVEIGPNGIWAGAEFITDWAGFVRARITTETVREYRRREIIYKILEIDHVHEGGAVFRRRLNISDAPEFDGGALMEAIGHFQASAIGEAASGRERQPWIDP